MSRKNGFFIIYKTERLVVCLHKEQQNFVQERIETGGSLLLCLTCYVDVCFQVTILEFIALMIAQKNGSRNFLPIQRQMK